MIIRFDHEFEPLLDMIVHRFDCQIFHYDHMYLYTKVDETPIPKHQLSALCKLNFDFDVSVYAIVYDDSVVVYYYDNALKCYIISHDTFYNSFRTDDSPAIMTNINGDC